MWYARGALDKRVMYRWGEAETHQTANPKSKQAFAFPKRIWVNLTGQSKHVKVSVLLPSVSHLRGRLKGLRGGADKEFMLSILLVVELFPKHQTSIATATLHTLPSKQQFHCSQRKLGSSEKGPLEGVKSEFTYVCKYLLEER